jgi:hypothetical protein
VLDEAHLGLFSFTKYLMWKDLQDRTAQLKANRVVQHLIDHPGEARARARRGRLRVEERHGLDQAIGRVEAVYDAALRHAEAA